VISMLVMAVCFVVVVCVDGGWWMYCTVSVHATGQYSMSELYELSV
jgi:hypothetical protein